MEYIPALKNVNIDQFKSIVQNRKPVIIKNEDIGPCTNLWTPEYMCHKVKDRPVKVHASLQPNMNFINKNFKYDTMQFHDFVRKVFNKCQEYYYLRCLGIDARGKDIADFFEHFQELSDDLQLPKYIEKDDYFSSVLRISSPGVRLWTHYDIMDNILVQVRGTKKVVLWSPEDALNMYLVGDKSAVLDIDNPDLKQFPLFDKARRYECVLQPGDILYIPALWFHNVLALQAGVAVNIFWKNLQHEFYDKKDTYGNRDLLPAVAALQAVDRGIKALQVLPHDYKQFYIKRMLTKLEQQLEKSEESSNNVTSTD